ADERTCLVRTLPRPRLLARGAAAHHRGGARRACPGPDGAGRGGALRGQRHGGAADGGAGGQRGGAHRGRQPDRAGGGAAADRLPGRGARPGPRAAPPAHPAGTGRTGPLAGARPGPAADPHAQLVLRPPAHAERQGGVDPTAHGPGPADRQARVATSTALIVCMRFSASSKTTEWGDSKTSSVTSSDLSPCVSYTSRATCVPRTWKAGRQCRNLTSRLPVARSTSKLTAYRARSLIRSYQTSFG